MNPRTFYILPALYVIASYATAIAFFVAQDERVSELLLNVPLIAIVLSVFGLIYGYSRFDSTVFLNLAVLVKCALIPYFLLGGSMVALTLLLSFAPVPFFLFVMPAMAFLFSAAGWVVMVGGSVFAFAYLLKLRSEGGCGTAFVVLNSLAQLFFVADVVDTMALAWRVGAWRRLTVVLLILAAVFCIAAIVAVSVFVFTVLAA